MKAKILRSSVISIALGVVAALGFAAPAHAVYNCTSGFSSVGAYSKCGSPSNTWYRTNVLCQNRFTLNSRVVSGNWVSTSSTKPSTVQGCAWYERYYGMPWASS